MGSAITVRPRGLTETKSDAVSGMVPVTSQAKLIRLAFVRYLTGLKQLHFVLSDF